MKTRLFKRFGIFFFILLLGICILPTSVKAEKQIVLSSFKELKEMCSDISNVPASFLCTSGDFVISEDFEIPSYVTITFRNFTVPEGVALTVSDHAEIRTYGFTVRGSLINRGKVVQQDLSEPWAGEDVRLFALIPGLVENKGEMILTDVFGKRNITRFGGKLIIYETPLYEETRRNVFGEEIPMPTFETVNTPSPAPAPLEKGAVQRTYDILENVIPKLAFFLVLVCFFSVVKIGITTARKEKRRKEGTGFTEAAANQPIRNNPDGKTASDVLYPSSREDHFQRDKRQRIEQLDAWLKNGLIDRKEYNELKHRYLEDR